MTNIKTHIVSFLLASMPGLCFPQVGHDTIFSDSALVPDVEILSVRHTSSLQVHANEIVMDLRLMDNMPKIMGNADPVRHSQFLPMVQMNNEYDAGLHIQGCDNGHNIITIDGAPIYNASHLFGFFSIFNPSHYDKMSLKYSPGDGNAPNRLGGQLNLYHTDSLEHSTNGTFSVGPMSSQGTLRLPTGKKSSLKLSLRASYLELLYSPLLKQDDYSVGYFFDDLNMTYKYTPTSSDLLWFDIYGGYDRARLDENTSASTFSLKWGNIMASSHWKHSFKKNIQLHQMLSVSYYKSRFSIGIHDTHETSPSSLLDCSYNGDLQIGEFRTGLSFTAYNINPEAPVVTGNYNITTPAVSQHPEEISLYFDINKSLSEYLSFNAGIRGSLYNRPDGGIYSALDPSLSVSAVLPRQTTLTLTASSRHQYISQIDLSGINMPVEFWIASDKELSPQRSTDLSLTVEQPFADNQYSVQMRLFHKQLYNQLEYTGSYLDLLYKEYNYKDCLNNGNGTNYGFSIMLNKRSGKLTGWVSYTYTHTRRSFDKLTQESSYPASHERPHEINVLTSYNLNDHWKFGATYVFASGTPFTAPKNFFVYAGNIVSTFGKHNANRLPAYSRMDISINYVLKKAARGESGLNLSLYNVLYRSNTLFYRLKFYEGQFAYRRLDFLVRILPSISYYRNF